MSRKSVVLFFLCLMLCACAAPSLRAGGSKDQVCFGDNCFEVEIALTRQQRGQGLMFRKALDLNKGMLFIFEEDGVHSFWMKNTYLPLDIIWLDADRKIVFIKKSAQPCHDQACLPIFPDASARYVLEVNAGITANLGIKPGDKAEFIGQKFVK